MSANGPLELEDELKKLEIASGEADNLITATFTHEDHTLGNALRWILMKNPDVDFCGYSVPHPSEPKMNVRLQTKEGKPAVDVLRQGVSDLISISEYTLGAFTSAFSLHLDNVKEREESGVSDMDE